MLRMQASPTIGNKIYEKQKLQKKDADTKEIFYEKEGFGLKKKWSIRLNSHAVLCVALHENLVGNS